MEFKPLKSSSGIPTRIVYEVSIRSYKGMLLVFSDDMSKATEWLRNIRPRYAVHNQNHRTVVGLSIDDAYVTLFIGKHGICVSLSGMPPQIQNFIQKPNVIIAGYNIDEKKEKLREASGIVVSTVLELRKTPAPIGLLPVEGPPVELHFLATEVIESLYGVNPALMVDNDEAELKVLFLTAFQSFFVGKELMKVVE